MQPWDASRQQLGNEAEFYPIMYSAGAANRKLNLLLCYTLP